ncbi:hypothetical protein C4561_01045 [candidate division WWE3 bacterium]|jgi:hypothetical protein|uniref:Uncharacterized protein n=1 Tax=candidate division WWE3 bacterium TaxID=2053526 RepID=A0A3A4ZLU7_UNCKA|nr:MAG: hypothetical protein C4561_01045 [candidate division WWE3 bacterium]
MKNTKVIVVVLIAIALVGILASVFMKKKPGVTSRATVPTEQTQRGDNGSDEESFVGNIYDLLERGETVTCTFYSEDQGSKIEGTVYVSGKNSRSDIIATNTDGTVIENHSIIKDEMMYMWSSDREEGMKLTMPKNEAELEENLPDETDTTPKVDAKAVMEKLNYKCNPWKVDQRLLDIPNDINFVDLTKQMEELQMNQVKEACAMCDEQADADAVAQCKKILNCQ